MYLAVKTSGTKQRFIQYVYTVGSSQDDNATVGTETIHLCQQLVQCVLAFIKKAVEVGTANLINPTACRDIIRNLPAAMDCYGIENLKELTSSAQGN